MSDFYAELNEFYVLHLEPTKRLKPIPIPDSISQVLNRNLAFDYNRRGWRPLRSDRNGSLYVIPTTPFNNKVTTELVQLLNNSVTLIVEESAVRNFLYIQNFSDTIIRIGFQSGFTTDEEIELYPDSIMDLGNYSGAVWAVGANTTINIKIISG